MVGRVLQGVERVNPGDEEVASCPADKRDFSLQERMKAALSRMSPAARNLHPSPRREGGGRMELSGAPVLRRRLSAFTTGVLDKGPAGPGLEPQKWEKWRAASADVAGGGSASSVSDWRPSDALAHHLQPPPCAFGPGTAASSRLLQLERAARLAWGSRIRGAARPARLRGTVRAQLCAVPAGGAWPNLHSTLRPCDVSRAFLYKAGERRNSCNSFRPSFCVPFSRALRALPPTMSTGVYPFPMEVAVYQLHNFSISFFSSLLGGDVVSVKLDNR